MAGRVGTNCPGPPIGLLRALHPQEASAKVHSAGAFIAAITLRWPRRPVRRCCRHLEQLTTRAGRIFRGTVLSVRRGSVNLARIPRATITYRIRVEDAFRTRLLRGRPARR